MSEIEADARTQAESKADLVFEYELDAPPEKVWRAIGIPAFRDKWLPQQAGAEPVSSVPGQEARFRIRENEPPFLESIVTFQLEPNADGGTRLRIVHGLASARRTPQSANDDWPTLMRAA